MTRTPFLARALLALLPARHREFIIGDLEEEYVLRRLPRDGRIVAGIWYWRQAVASLISETRHRAPIIELGEPRRGSMFDHLRQDLRYTFRSLNARPVFTTVAVLTLALGIGANTGIFSIANWMLLRPVSGVSKPDELVMIEFAESPGNSIGLSWLNLTDVRRMVSSFQDIAGSQGAMLQVLTEGAAPIAARAETVGGDYFGLLGVAMQRGRPIYASETVPGEPVPVAVISDGMWTELYGRNPDVIGRTLRANKQVFTVVGVAPRGFRGTDRLGTADVWVPFSMIASLRHMDPSLLSNRAGFRLRELIARLKPGVTPEAAETDLRRALASVIEQHPKENEIYNRRPVHVYAGIGVPVLMRDHTQRLVRIMLGVVGLLLIICSANVANMLLVRATQKRSETAMRRALGASSGRLAAQQITESLVLALLGGIAGLLVARAFLMLIEGGRTFHLQPIENVPIDGRVLAFTFIVCVVTGLFFGLAPLGVLRRLDLARELHGSSARHTGRSGRLRGAIAITQVALSLVLLVGALLLGRTLNSMLNVDFGYELDRLAGVLIWPEPQGYKREESLLLGRAVLEQVRRSPAVESAALMYVLPFGGGRAFSGAKDPLNRSDEPIQFEMQYVSDGFFSTFGIPMLGGRAIDERDWSPITSGEIPVVLSQTAASSLFGPRDPIGQLITTATFNQEVLRVVGIARDARLNGLTEPMSALVYYPISALRFGELSVVARSRGDVSTLEPELRRAVATVNAAIPPRYEVVTDNIRSFMSEQRLLATLFTLFSVVAALLAGIGLYGVLGSNVTERRREFGLRMALGADASRIFAIVALQSARLVAIGLILGVVAALWLSRFIETQLFGVNRLDASTYIAAALLFALIAAIATAVPTRSATRVNPFVALRQE